MVSVEKLEKIKVKDRKKKKEEEENWIWSKIVVDPMPQHYEVLTRYDIRPGLSEVVIACPPQEVVTPTYFVVEVPLTEREKKTVDLLTRILSREITPPTSLDEHEEVKEYLHKTVFKLLEKYKGIFGTFDEISRMKIAYYTERNMLGFGPLTPLMEDYRIEDISCDGVNKPIFVWHRDFESLPTNIKFIDKDALDNYIIQLAHKSGKHVSSAFPIVDAMIYGKHRLAATFREEVSPSGSTFTIRKFREEPLSITSLVKANVLNSLLAAYYWTLLENKMTVMIIGATGSGKTTTLNALACLLKPTMKVVTCEETPELKIPLENWVRFVTRESYGLGASKIGEVSLYDLVKTSLRYRPDYIIVGEIRGEEAFVLFQAISTGHGGLSTLHADSVEAAVRRLVSPPMNIPKPHIPLMNCVSFIQRVILGRTADGRIKIGRRICYVWEVEDYSDKEGLITRMISRWDPHDDRHQVILSDSYLLEKIAIHTGKHVEEIYEEIEGKRVVIDWMVRNNIEKIEDVAKVIYRYYIDPKRLEKEILHQAPELIKPKRVVKEVGELDVEVVEKIIMEVVEDRGKIKLENLVEIVEQEGENADALVPALNRLIERRRVRLIGDIVALPEVVEGR